MDINLSTAVADGTRTSAVIDNAHVADMEHKSVRDACPAKAALNLVYLPRINYALQQNSIAIIRSLKVENLTELPLNQVIVHISSRPAFAMPQKVNIDRILPRSTHSFETIPLELDYQYLADLSERVKGCLVLQVTATTSDEGETTLAEERFEVEACACDDWMGADVMPQLLAAFVTPNLDVVSSLQTRMSQLLKDKEADPSLEGYQQKDRKRCLEMIEAAYHAILEQGINYANPPASFECCGQRIRFADRILKDKLATCLDFALLFASILEQCGLNPLILLQKGHAYVGCHLSDESFHDSFFDDLQAIRKRAELDELFVFESTGAASATRLSFAQAESAARKHLEKDDEFIGALDVKQARIEKIRPVPLRRNTDGSLIFEVQTATNDTPLSASLQGCRDLLAPIVSEEPDTPQSRLQRWQQKLLDLSKRNKLLNFKTKGKAVPIAFTNLPMLEDQFASGTTFQIKPSVPLIDGTDIRDLSLLELQTGGNPVSQYLKDEFDHKRLRSHLSEAELPKRLLELYRQAKNDLDESGVGTLYLALGFLEWKEKSRDSAAYKAPILLLPMKLERRSVREAFTLERADEETVINVTLLEMMARDFGKTIPGISIGELPMDDSGVDVNAVFQRFQQAVKDLPGWEVRKEACLSCFSFQKFVMWNDLRNRTDDLLKNAVVDHLINHPKELFNDGIEAVTPDQLDKNFHYDQIFCPKSADSSQMSAILSAANGKTFVLYGPPGTGKSQSITNMIAHCLAVGKKVLFVAEKRAALEVVFKRLDEVGLAPFCLELHSHKAGKNEVMEQFRRVLEYREKASPADWDLITRKLEDAKKQLNGYINALHQDYPCGFTPYHVFSFLIQHAGDDEGLESVGRIRFPVSSLAKNELDAIVAIGEEMTLYGRELPESAWHAFRHIGAKEWSPDWANESAAVAVDLCTHAMELKKTAKTILQQLGIEVEIQKESELYAIADLASSLKEASSPLPERFYGADWPTFSEQLIRFGQLAQRNEQNIARLKTLEFFKLHRLCREDVPIRVDQPGGNLFQFGSAASFSCPAENLPDWAVDAKRRMIRYCEAVNALQADTKLIFREWNYDAATFTELEAFRLSEILKGLDSPPGLLPSELIGKEWKPFAAEVRGLIEAGRSRDHVRAQLSDFDLNALLPFDIVTLKRKMEVCNTGLALFKGVRRAFLMSTVKKCLESSKTQIVYESIPEYLERFQIYQTSQRQLNSITLDCSRRLGKLWSKGDADWDELNSLLRFGDRLEKAICDFSEDDVCRTRLREGIGAYLLARQDHPVESHFSHFQETLKEYTDASGDFFAIFKQDHGLSPHTAGNTLLDEWKEDGNAVRERGTIDIAEFVALVANFVFTHAETTSFAREHDLAERIPFAWSKGRCDQEALRQAVLFVTPIDSCVQRISFLPPDELSSVRDHLGRILGQVTPLLGKEGTLRRDINALIGAWNHFSDSLPRLIEHLSIAPEFRQQQGDRFLDDCNTLAQAVIDHGNDLRNWCLWRKTRAKAMTAHLESIVAAIESRRLPFGKINYAIEKRLKEKFADEVVGNVAALRDFLGTRQNELIRNFRKWDDEYANLTKQLVVARVSAGLPGAAARRGDPRPGTELGELQREVQRQTRHKPVRMLLEKIPNILPALKPCMLMSPLSVAQYLPPTQELFDVVIFDEASQIPPWDAVGAIARGKQLVVCGDPKQLPPTEFFQKQANDEDEADDDSNIPDEKSILDECLAAGIDQVLLNWHYRSRHESLIAFSNHHYYENRLMTFPHAWEAKHLGVQFHFVKNGVYDRKKSCTNKPEARELVSEVIERLRSPEFAGKSLGIVTFSMRQQVLIEDLLEEERRKYPKIERFFQSDYPEPVFVKNLENVQGDERDVMFFSICYGPDEAGQKFMNFGPLSRDGGERRLNVAVTRAKESTVVFSSIRFDFIDPVRVTKKGPLHLRAFLDYAERDHSERGKALAGETSGGGLFDYDSIFEEQVADFLREQGCAVQTQVGCSGYRIDLAIVDPQKPGRYVLGIECDGATYHSSATARDRDKLRQGVLENLGWRITRVWSTEWWFNRERTAETLLQEVRDALQAVPQMDIPPPEPLTPAEEVVDEEEETESAGSPEEFDCEFKLDYPNLDQYQNHPEFRKERNSEDFYEPCSRSIIQRQIAAVIAVESPILQSILQQRITSAWGFSRAGRKVVEILTPLYPKQYTASNGERVFWSNEMNPGEYPYFRVPANDYSRTIEEIPVQELRNAMKWLLQEYHAFQDHDMLFKETARIFGFRRLTEPSKKYYKAALKLLEQEGVVG